MIFFYNSGNIKSDKSPIKICIFTKPGAWTRAPSNTSMQPAIRENYALKTKCTTSVFDFHSVGNNESLKSVKRPILLLIMSIVMS